MITANQIKELFNMVPLQNEGGVYCQTYISDEIIPKEYLPGRASDRPVCSAIYYLLTPNTFSRMHRLPTDEIFHFYLGASVEMLQLYPDGQGKIIRMGHDILDGEMLQVTVPRGVWQGTRVIGKGEFSLLGTSMSPGFDPADYEDGDMDALIARYPQFKEQLSILAGAPRY